MTFTVAMITKMAAKIGWKIGKWHYLSIFETFYREINIKHKQIPTGNCVYETLCPQPLTCPQSCSPGNLFTILLQLTKSEATNCNSFQDIFIGSFRCPNLQRALTKKNAKTIIKKIYIYFIYFHQVIYSLPSISAPSCNDFWDIKFSMSKFAKGNNWKKWNDFLRFLPSSLLTIFYKLTKFEAPGCKSFWDINFSIFF